MNSLQLQYHLIEEWPPLAWLARCIVSESVITIYHGSMVETNENWFGEIVWDSEYDKGDFDLTDLAFGSGGRVREGYITFVPSGSTVDRLWVLDFGEKLWISNSLPCLLRLSGATAIPKFNYPRWFSLIVKGLDKYERKLPTSKGLIQVAYFNNLRWDGQTLVEVEKFNQTRDFSTFVKYRDFLSSSLGKIAKNMTANERQYPYQMLGTLSSGYDSPTVTVLARPHGLNEVISFKNARSGAEDNGSEIADLLGVKLSLISRTNWQSCNSKSPAEEPFFAADPSAQDIYFAGAENKLGNCVLLTGFHGDKIWDKNTKDLSPNIVRGDRSGLSLAEYRLHAGFIHLPVPFMGVRQIKDINLISNQLEMKPWDVPGNYSRPICRRIVEEAGVPRSLFGIAKKATSILFLRENITLSSEANKDYQKWLLSHPKFGLTRGDISDVLDKKMIKYLFHWAIEKTKKRYDLPKEMLI